MPASTVQWAAALHSGIAALHGHFWHRIIRTANRKNKLEQQGLKTWLLASRLPSPAQEALLLRHHLDPSANQWITELDSVVYSLAQVPLSKITECNSSSKNGPRPKKSTARAPTVRSRSILRKKRLYPTRSSRQGTYAFGQ